MTLVDGNTRFAFDLYRVLSGEEGNLFYSPYSISLALAMTYTGARGGTERQMADTLHLLDGREVMVPMMAQTRFSGYADAERGGLEGFEAALDAGRLGTITGGLAGHVPSSGVRVCHPVDVV